MSVKKEKKSGAPKKLTSVRKIAHALQISANTISQYLARPDAPKRGPGGYDMEEVSAYISAQTNNSTTAVRVDAGVRNLKERELKLKCDRLEHWLKKDRGFFVEKAKLGPLLYNLAVHQRVVLQRKLEQELFNAMAGLTPPEILERLRAATDTVCAIFKEGVKDFLVKQPDEPPSDT